MSAFCESRAVGSRPVAASSRGANFDLAQLATRSETFSLSQASPSVADVTILFRWSPIAASRSSTTTAMALSSSDVHMPRSLAGVQGHWKG